MREANCLIADALEVILSCGVLKKVNFVIADALEVFSSCGVALEVDFIVADVLKKFRHILRLKLSNTTP